MDLSKRDGMLLDVAILEAIYATAADRHDRRRRDEIERRHRQARPTSSASIARTRTSPSNERQLALISIVSVPDELVIALVDRQR